MSLLAGRLPPGTECVSVRRAILCIVDASALFLAPVEACPSAAILLTGRHVRCSVDATVIVVSATVGNYSSM